jgi:protein-L-isoaspartate(D-aspartate) O-methyltransferase
MSAFIRISGSMLVPVLMLVILAAPNPHPDKQGTSTPIYRSVSPADTSEWHRPRFSEREEERLQMVEQALEQQGINDSATLEAMRNVPRHLFVPESQRQNAYRNSPLPIGEGQTISQPYIVGYMTQMLDLSPGDKVLEIGTGSGYQAAVLSEITPEVYSIEIIRTLGEQAAERFEELEYETIQTKIDDGYYGWKEHAPFDAIIVTAASGHIPPPLIEQLKPEGKMVIPIGGTYQTQTLMEVTRNEEGDIQTERKLPVRFVPLTGAAQNREN